MYLIKILPNFVQIIPMTISKPTAEEVNKIDLSHFEEAIKDCYSAQFVNKPAGVEHYKLLAWISTQFKKGTIVEVGCHEGAGALALSFGGRKVETFDLMDKCHPYIKQVVKFTLAEGTNSLEAAKKAKVVFVDAIHSGVFELEFLQELMKESAKPIVIFDDIHLNDEMKAFWSEVKKLGVDAQDWTDVGHWSGTGVVIL